MRKPRRQAAQRAARRRETFRLQMQEVVRDELRAIVEQAFRAGATREPLLLALAGVLGVRVPPKVTSAGPRAEVIFCCPRCGPRHVWVVELLAGLEAVRCETCGDLATAPLWHHFRRLVPLTDATEVKTTGYSR